MNLYLLRHAIAARRDSPHVRTDRQRPLTAKGAKRMRQIADAMKNMDLSFDLILSSPYVRARQTAKIVGEAMQLRKRLQLSDRLAVGSSPRSLLDHLSHLRPQPGNVLLVGHEPFLSSLMSLLLSGRQGLHFELKKGGLCRLTVGSLSAQRRAMLRWLLTPKQILQQG